MTQDDDQDGESRRAERHIDQVKRQAGEGAHVEGVPYEGDVAEGGPPESNQETQEPNSTGEGAPLEAPDEPMSRDEER
jgi:hypothetical protein